MSELKKANNEGETILGPEGHMFYLNHDKTSLEYNKSWANGEVLATVHTISLGSITRKQYNRIEFLSGNGDSIYSKASWGNDAYPGKSINDVIKNKDTAFYLLYDDYRDASNLKDVTTLKLLDEEKRVTGKAKMKIYCSISHYNFFYMNFLQIITYMYGESWASFNGGGLWVNYGNAVKLSYVDPANN